MKRSGALSSGILKLSALIGTSVYPRECLRLNNDVDRASKTEPRTLFRMSGRKKSFVGALKSRKISVPLFLLDWQTRKGRLFVLLLSFFNDSYVTWGKRDRGASMDNLAVLERPDRFFCAIAHLFVLILCTIIGN